MVRPLLLAATANALLTALERLCALLMLFQDSNNTQKTE